MQSFYLRISTLIESSSAHLALPPPPPPPPLPPLPPQVRKEAHPTPPPLPPPQAAKKVHPTMRAVEQSLVQTPTPMANPAHNPTSTNS